MPKQQGIKYICDLCGDLIEIGRPRFIWKGELFCAYDGGTFDETTHTPPEKMKDEMRRILELLEQKSEKELNDEVHYPFQMDLCRRCRDKIYQLLDEKKISAM
ncbi:MAG: hypothetical protein C4527_09600 [Candidatus Omnitrophota bacterium]|jgi:hypothetical protein|nr:MAG: hypothetical protein C4527_09600 [Candidatus Omnitrophota bacterium]